MSVAVQEMFQSIADRYDLANDVLSLGLHRSWRKKAIAFGNIKSGESVIDLCTGTGDFAFDLSRKVGDQGSVTAFDFVEKMIFHAKEKQLSEPNFSNITFAQGDAMSIASKDNCFDAATISFGIRNVDNPTLCLKEINRVLKPSGRVIVLEFGQPSLIGFKQIYNLYCKTLMPLIGGVITGNRAAYQYLPETSKAFPCRNDFLQLMSQAGFSGLAYQSLFAGIAYIYLGIKGQ